MRHRTMCYSQTDALLNFIRPKGAKFSKTHGRDEIGQPSGEILSAKTDKRFQRTGPISNEKTSIASRNACVIAQMSRERKSKRATLVAKSVTCVKKVVPVETIRCPKQTACVFRTAIPKFRFRLRFVQPIPDCCCNTCARANVRFRCRWRTILG